MKKFFTNNLALKILAIIGAVFLWLYVINEGYEVGFVDAEIPIETYNLAEDLAVAGDLGTAKIQVRAPAQSWSKISSENITAFVDLKSLRKGLFSKEVKVTVDDPSITILNVEPEKISVTLEELQSLSKDIEVETTGKVNEAYETQDAAVNFEKAEIKGSQSSLEKVNKVIAPIKLNGEMTEIKSQVELEARDINNDKITNLVIIPKVAEVTIPVRKKNEIKTVGIKANITGNPADGYWIKQTTVSPNSVAIQGNADIISGLSYLNTQQIDISNIAGTTERDVGLELPDEVTAIDVDQIKVKIEVDAQSSTQSTTATIRYAGIDPSLIVTSASPSKISVKITGPAPQLEVLQSGDVTVTLDLRGKSAGEQTISISSDIINLPAGVSLQEIQTKEVKLVIQKR